MRRGDGIGRRLRESRGAAGLSQADVEALRGIPKARLSRYENGHVDPSLRTLRCLARALNVSEATLLGDGIDVVQEFYLRLSGSRLLHRFEGRGGS